MYFFCVRGDRVAGLRRPSFRAVLFMGDGVQGVQCGSVIWRGHGKGNRIGESCRGDFSGRKVTKKNTNVIGSEIRTEGTEHHGGTTAKGKDQPRLWEMRNERHYFLWRGRGEHRQGTGKLSRALFVMGGLAKKNGGIGKQSGFFFGGPHLLFRGPRKGHAAESRGVVS